MNKLLPLLIILLLGNAVHAQQVNVTGFTVKPALPPDIKTVSPPTLKEPANGQTIASGRQQLFSWQAPMPTPTGTITYKIKIVEIKGDQLPENAIRGNKPFFERDSIKALSFQYTSPAPAFVAGIKYAWGVSIYDRWGNQKWSNDGKSEIFSFKAPL